MARSKVLIRIIATGAIYRCTCELAEACDRSRPRWPKQLIPAAEEGAGAQTESPWWSALLSSGLMRTVRGCLAA